MLLQLAVQVDVVLPDELHDDRGFWLVTTTDQGFIYGTHYLTEAPALRDFRLADDAYSEWLGDDDDD